MNEERRKFSGERGHNEADTVVQTPPVRVSMDGQPEACRNIRSTNLELEIFPGWEVPAARTRCAYVPREDRGQMST